ncbi:tRNA pseudouridine(13) synthase TruD, partial [Candidatus Woesearchaeota archaeon]|nr:tRNA pseudouridine(13) synthase TruD [Candidatus Woesearchaeota archaeon]
AHSYFLMKKIDSATPFAIEKIAKFLNIDTKRIRFAGTKDRKAITTQYISIEKCPDRIKEFYEPNIKLEFKGKCDKPIYLGMNEGNEFEITIRNIKKTPKKIKQFLNLFDEQRFSMNNVEIGRAIIKKDFKKAVEILMRSNGYYERRLKETYEKTNNAVNSLRNVPFNVINFFIHAYQSEIWNKCAEKIKSKKNIKLPIIGFGTEIKDKKIKKICEKVMKEEGIDYRDFIIKSYPELSSEGNSRDLYAEVKNLKIGKLENDELNPKMKKGVVKFFLGKGNYATMGIRNMF